MEAIQSSPTEEKESTPIVFPSSTALPTIAFTSTPAVTPFPTTPAQATIEAFDSLCIGSKKVSMSEISTNGKWIAALCYSENGKERSPLQVVSLDRSKEWKIYYHDYGKGGFPEDRHDGIIPYRWSNDERFLYVVAGSRASGCCWIGGKYVLLVRLNLETGEQTEIINGTDFGSDLPFSLTISENDHFLLFTPITSQPYDFIVLDLLSGEERVVNLKPEISNHINLEFAVMSPYEDIIVLPLFENIEFNEFKVTSIGMINMTTGKQSLLVSDLKQEEELYPIRWIDANQVLLSSANPAIWYEQASAEYWGLNIDTGQRERVENP
jgi:hypothetical protein